MKRGALRRHLPLLAALWARDPSPAPASPPPDSGWPEGDGDNVEPLDEPEDWESYGVARPTVHVRAAELAGAVEAGNRLVIAGHIIRGDQP